jgi:tripartite-type tricarboxylate transporter receptor subunit TctC
MRLLAALDCLAAVLCGSSAAAQDYPVRPIRVITVTSAGGTSDIFMRALVDAMHKGLGQPTVIENRPGGAFNFGAGPVRKPRPTATLLHSSGRAARVQPVPVQVAGL